MLTGALLAGLAACANPAASPVRVGGVISPPSLVKVAGVVVDVTTEAPVAGATVVVIGRDGRSVTAITDQEGRFLWATAGPVRVEVTAPGFERQTIAGAEGEAMIRLVPDARETVRRFMQALAQGRYADMWAMLSPPAQGTWPSAEFFALYLGKKFGSYSLAFTLGETKTQPQWTDPDSGSTWAEAALLLLALTLNGAEVPAFAALPVVVAKGDGLWRVVGAGPAARGAPLVLPASLPAKTLAVPILVYHHIAEQPPTDYLQRTMTEMTAEFEEELIYLRDAGYQTITLRELFEALYYDVPLPPKAVVLSFDDGYEDAYTQAFPLLQRYGFVATFAIPTGLVGSRGYLTWQQIRAMAAAGMEFVSHSVSHRDLGAMAEGEATDELRRSKLSLEEALGRPVQFFVYPYGEPFAHGSPETQQAIIELLWQEGYVLAVTNPLPGEPPAIIQRAEAPYQLVRVNVPGGLPLARFIARLEGSDPWLRR